MIDNAVYREGMVAVRYYQPVPKYIRIGNKEYVCSVQHSVSLLFVPEEEVGSLLSYKGGCCGGQRLVFSLASQDALNVWMTGNR